VDSAPVRETEALDGPGLEACALCGHPVRERLFLPGRSWPMFGPPREHGGAVDVGPAGWVQGWARPVVKSIEVGEGVLVSGARLFGAAWVQTVSAASGNDEVGVVLLLSPSNREYAASHSPTCET